MRFACRKLLIAGWLAVAVGSVAAAQDFEPPISEADVREVPFGVDRLLAPRWRLADGPHVRAAFREVVRKAAKATVRVWSDGKHAALGCVVDGEGWVLTKASALGKRLRCEWPDGRDYQAELVALDGKYDVALLKIEVHGLDQLPLHAGPTPAVGSFVATVGPGGDPVAVGVVSVGPREIPPQSGKLGVQLSDEPDEDERTVIKVFPDSGAEQAGIVEGDVILRIDGKQVATRGQLQAAVRQFNPGDQITVSIERDGETLKFSAVLSGRFNGLPPSRSQFQNELGGQLSVRRFGFPRAFQHDTVLRPSDCGGPVVNLDGEVVGMNIARSGRTESYALSSNSMQKLFADLRLADKATVTAP